MLGAIKYFHQNQLDAHLTLNAQKVKHAETDNVLILVNQRTHVLHLQYVQ